MQPDNKIKQVQFFRTTLIYLFQRKQKYWEILPKFKLIFTEVGKYKLLV